MTDKSNNDKSGSKPVNEDEAAAEETANPISKEDASAEETTEEEQPESTAIEDRSDPADRSTFEINAPANVVDRDVGEETFTEKLKPYLDRFFFFARLGFFGALIFMFVVELIPIAIAVWFLGPVIDARYKIIDLTEGRDPRELFDPAVREDWFGGLAGRAFSFLDNEKPPSSPRPSPTWRYLPLSKFSRPLVETLIAGEDARFYDHGGVDVSAMITILEESKDSTEKPRGGSTITMQVARTMFLNQRRSYMRKVREILIALLLEEHLEKDKIVELYLNFIDWGDGLVGAGDAAKKYFNLSPSKINWDQAVYLVSLLPNPHAFAKPEGASRFAFQRKLTWTKLYNNRIINREEYCETVGEAKIAEPICGTPAAFPGAASSSTGKSIRPAAGLSSSPATAPVATLGKSNENKTVEPVKAEPGPATSVINIPH